MTSSTPASTDYPRIGLWLASLGGATVPQVREVAAQLEQQGWHSLWFGEAIGREAFVQANLLLDATNTIRVGTGIASIWARDAHAAASIARTYEAMYPGRFTLGLGVSHAPLVQRRNHEYNKPLKAMREYLSALNSTAPEVASEETLPDVVIAALGPKMLELAGSLAQGAHPYLTTPEHTAQAREILGGDATSGPRLVVEQAAVIAPAAVNNKDEWRRRAYEHLNFYTGLPNYRNSWKRLGFDDSDFVRGGSARLQETLVPRGVEATQAAVQAHLEAGASEVVVQVLGESILDTPMADWEALAQELLPHSG